ncbi:MAG: YwbE family protein [Bacteroidetes bacterium]|jgi:uncharacterized repeat protein (TIGR03833 family)|nr:YwbE family protein [Bacteroidota bacterium]
MEGQNRTSIKPGDTVDIIKKEHQRSGILTTGVVQQILTKSASHPHGIKVRLSSGEIGRVKSVHPAVL